MESGFVFTFPCFVFAEILKSKRNKNIVGMDNYSAFNATQGRSILMIFTDEDLAKQQLGLEAGLPNREVVSIPTRSAMMEILQKSPPAMSHVVFDPIPTPRMDRTFPKGDLLQWLLPAKGSQ